MPLFGPPNIEKLKARRKTGRLSAALQYEDGDPREQARIRAQAARALGEIGEPETVQPLLGALDDESGLVRCSAARALGAIGDDRAAEPLITALQDRDGAVRREAVRALGRIGSSQAVYPLAR
jgi:HEAT repeat protein